VGEFLAIVDGLRWLRQNRKALPIYSDSQNAIGWIRAAKCGTKLRRTPANRKLFEMIDRCEAELPDLLRMHGTAAAGPRVLKWDTARWGEIPADFGRK
jgi:ribonuclease HI